MFFKLIKTNNMIGEIWRQTSKSLCLCAQSNSETSLGVPIMIRNFGFSFAAQWVTFKMFIFQLVTESNERGCKMYLPA